MSDLCMWPGCRLEYAVMVHDGKRMFSFCDIHGDMIHDEVSASMKRARKKAGMEVPVKIRGYVVGLSTDVHSARCAYPGCGYPVSLVIYTDDFPEHTRGIPACNDHYTAIEKSGIPNWDGVWHRFIPGGKLDALPLFGEDGSVIPDIPPAPESPKKERKAAEIVKEVEVSKEVVEKETAYGKGLMERLLSGDFDPPED